MKVISLLDTNFSYTLQCFYLLNYKIWRMLQDQNKRHPRAMRMHCGWTG